MHKSGASLLVFLIQPLRLLELFIHQHFPVLIADDEDLRAGGDLAAELTDLVQFIIYGGLNDALMLIRHSGDVLQVKMRQQMVSNFIAHHRTVRLLIVNEHPKRQYGNNLFIQRPEYAQLIAGSGRNR